VFLDPPFADAIFQSATHTAGKEQPFAARPYGVLTYLGNLIRHGEHATPYSMITATGPPLVPADMQDDEMLISQWLADDLNAGPGSEIDISYFLPDQAAQLAEQTNRFRVRAVLRMNHPSLDRSLMPDFPGVANAEKTGDWHTGFPLTHKIREKDDEYWKTYRGTPKALITLAAGQRLWASRFGRLTAIRFPFPDGADWYLEQSKVEMAVRRVLTGKSNSGFYASKSFNPSERFLDPKSVGFRFEPVREQALKASSQSQDFGQLFLASVSSSFSRR
jgi:hypothetical protein